MAIITTGVGQIDTSRFEPNPDLLNMMSIDELQAVCDVMQREAINIELQIERGDQEGDLRRQATARYALKMRRHNVHILERFMRARKQDFSSEKDATFNHFFVATAKEEMFDEDFEEIRDVAIERAFSHLKGVQA